MVKTKNNGVLVNTSGAEWVPVNLKIKAAGENMAIAGSGTGRGLRNQIAWTKNFTLAAWIKPLNLRNRQWIVRISGASLGLQGEQLVFSDSKKEFIAKKTIFSSNAWQHVAITIEGNQLRFYQNGKLKEVLAGVSINPTSTQAFFLGYNFNGAIDEFQVWNAVKSPIAIHELMFQKPDEQATDLAYYLEADKKNISANQKRGKAVATLNGSVPSIVPPDKRVFKEPGNDKSYIKFDSPGIKNGNCRYSTKLDLSNQFTVETWLKATKFQNWGGGATIPILRFGNDGSPIALRYSQGNKIRLHCTLPGQAHIDLKNSMLIEKDFPLNEWHHIAVVYENTIFKVYLDGILIGSKTYKGGKHSISTNRAFVGATATNLDDLRIWNIAKSANAIRTQMNKELKGNEKGLLRYYKMDDNKMKDFTNNSKACELEISKPTVYPPPPPPFETVNKFCKQQSTKASGSHKWVKLTGGKIPANAIQGQTINNKKYYVTRVPVNCRNIVGKIMEGQSTSFALYHNKEVQAKAFEVLVNNGKPYKWEWATANKQIPANAVVAGVNKKNKKICPCLGEYNSQMHIGWWVEGFLGCTISYGGKALGLDNYKLLIEDKSSSSASTAISTANINIVPFAEDKKHTWKKNPGDLHQYGIWGARKRTFIMTPNDQWVVARGRIKETFFPGMFLNVPNSRRDSKNFNYKGELFTKFRI